MSDKGHAERSLEQSRKLILEWAGELRHVDTVRAALTHVLLIDTPADRRTVIHGYKFSDTSSDIHFILNITEVRITEV